MVRVEKQGEFQGHPYSQGDWLGSIGHPLGRCSPQNTSTLSEFCQTPRATDAQSWDWERRVCISLGTLNENRRMVRASCEANGLSRDAARLRSDKRLDSELTIIIIIIMMIEWCYVKPPTNLLFVVISES